MERNMKKLLAVTVVLMMCLVNMLPVSAVEVSKKEEIKGKENVSMDGYNSIIVKQSTGTIIWVEDEDDAKNQEIIDAIVNADPSIKKDQYVVVTGEGQFNFGDHFDGNQYKKTSITVDGDGNVTIKGDYSHASRFTYDDGEEPTDPTEPETDPTEPETETETETESETETGDEPPTETDPTEPETETET
ncbi:MAG: hypothetical protein IJA84_06835, partial [Clostridia bacterium]|nr:hypothetical protein [Clostridia bacterium]